MKRIISELLAGKEENHILPFFWQHGEEEATLREYMAAIEKANCRAVCVESRPHPDFCGPKWWTDMDVILDEARKRGMKVWVLDDSHFPTGFANGAVKNAPLQLHRQSLCANSVCFDGPAQTVELDLAGMIPPEFKPVDIKEEYLIPSLLKEVPHFEDDQVLAVTAVCKGNGEAVKLSLPAEGEKLHWQKPEGEWTLWVLGLSRNCGPHREYINMLDPDSCRLLIDAVYESHYAHYKDDFGTTIAGFFSDEPELGNGHLYFYENRLGTDQDLPFADTMPAALKDRLGENWADSLYCLWSNEGDPGETARVRHAYMDAVTKLLRESFSRQLGDWCRAHGVRYIGHMIEDGNAHARTGSSLGHYFRGLDGQDMAGIDDIGGQVLPQGEDEPKVSANLIDARDGEFYHYMMGNLAASAAAIQPGKQGNAMCEIFGNYGWAEGLRLEKYLADHFMVRGINYYVPHAFSPAPFPDSDCPPHFYAHGHNPQYRHFGELMKYMNRICTLISGGHRKAEVSVLYHGEAEWAGEAMLTQKIARPLTEAQIAFDTIPADVFAEPEHYRTQLGNPFQVNTQEYKAFIIPESQYLTKATVLAVKELRKAGIPVLFINRLPQGVSDGEEELLGLLGDCQVLSLEKLVPCLRQMGIGETQFAPESSYLRVLHYLGEAEIYYFVNEAASVYEGTVTLPVLGSAYLYDAWENRVYPADIADGRLKVVLEPEKSLILIVDEAEPRAESVPAGQHEEELENAVGPVWASAEMDNWEPVELGAWERMVCTGIEYPHFRDAKAVTIPDHLAEEQPAFSGYAAYESRFALEKAEPILLEITDAFEGVEVFVNGQSAGIQIVPVYRYDLSNLVRAGENLLRIEVATTLERYCHDLAKDDVRMKFRRLKEPECGSGITGEVKLYRKK